MNSKLLSTLTCIFGFVLFFLFPGNGLAVEYSITDVKIDAFLNEDGTVNVNETHTYSFDGDFNGITREIIPKEGTNLSQFKATENGKSLNVEKEDGLYKIHRKGSDETITILLTYSIKNGVDVYSDVAEFYWPFFDERNESSYEHLTISIHPPKETDEVIAFGYDTAFKTEKIRSDGSVLFQFGGVPSGENGDIRVAYDAALFPQAPIAADTPMKNKILAAKQELLDEAEHDAAMSSKLSNLAKIVTPTLSILLSIIMIGAWLRARSTRIAVARECDSQVFSIPKQKMSLPATILYTNGSQLPGEAMGAAMMDLIRQGIISKTDHNSFILNTETSKLLKHEQRLVKLLFHEIGSNGEFSFDDLASYTKNKKNHPKYQSSQTRWLQTVKEEIKEHDLFVKISGLRWSIGILSLLLVTLLIFYFAYGLFSWFFATIFLCITGAVFALVYRPKTWEGLVITHEWNLIKKQLKDKNFDEWKSIDENDKMRVYIYGLGIKAKNLKNKSSLFTDSFEIPKTPNYLSGIYPGPNPDIGTLTYYGPMATTSFYTANLATRSADSSTSSTSGGGVGGGGGGSGAF